MSGWDGSIAALGSFVPSMGAVEFTNDPYYLFSSDFSPFNVTAQFIGRADGTIDGFTESGGNGNTNQIGTWTSDAPDAGDPFKVDGADYEMRITGGDGSLGDSAIDIGVWVTLDVDRTWTFSRNDGDSGNYTVELRDVATAGVNVFDTAALSVALFQEPPEP